MIYKTEMVLEGKTLSIEAGRVARQADGAVMVRYGDTVILATAVASRTRRNGALRFLPLTVEYREKAYAAGKIPGNFFRREGRPEEKETLSARLIDRTTRPFLPEDFDYETQVIVTVLSSDQENDADVLGAIGASAALCISDIPFDGPVGTVRVGRLAGVYIANPTFSQLDQSDLDMLISCTADSIAASEGWAQEISEDDMIEAMAFGHEHAKAVIELQEQLVRSCGRDKRAVPERPVDPGVHSRATELAIPRLRECNNLIPKLERERAIEEALADVVSQATEDRSELEHVAQQAFTDAQAREMRQAILEQARRLDGRKPEEMRRITCEVALLPRTHGSALFTRGETQSLAVTTLGTKQDEKLMDELEGETWKRYMLHYNFPPFSTGEARPLRAPARREIGHGALAERSLLPMMPSEEVFPYTIRIVSDILESNGSSSMATVCAASLSLMDAGVPIKRPVAGVAVGLVQSEDRWVVLTDIAGVEDQMGDMDFKVAGTAEGITGFQMDMKARGLNLDILKAALDRARLGRLHVLDEMGRVLPVPREQLSEYAPRIISLKIKPEQIREVIGPGGKTIKKIEEESGATISVEPDGSVQIACVNPEGGEKARQMVADIIAEPEVGRVYPGKVKRIMDFGAFVEILPGKDGLVHISELENYRVAKVTDVVREGDEVLVKVISIDRQGKVKLSRKAALGQDQKIRRE